MPTDFRLLKKSDAEILADVQSMCPAATAFSWEQDGTPRITIDGEPDPCHASRVAEYFGGNFRTWTPVEE